MFAPQMSRMPLLTGFNRVERFYTGGKLLDEWQGLTSKSDGHLSEEFLVSTNEYIGTGNPLEKGISQVFSPNNEKENLYKLISKDPKSFLGDRYVNHCYGHAGVQLRAGDSTSRSIIQCHPSNEQARAFFNIPFGKTEAWYIANTREINAEPAHVYCGFKCGITKEKWRELFANQDSQGMLDCLHRFEVKPGDCFLVKAGTPHSIGSGCFFIELHQPCDITLRMERNFTPQPLTDEQLHYGPGFEVLFDCFDYTGRSLEQTLAEIFMQPTEESDLEGGTVSSVIDFDKTPHFSMKKIVLRNSISLPKFEGHYLITITKGTADLLYDGGILNVPQGRAVFVPALCKELSASGNAELILAYPFSV